MLIIDVLLGSQFRPYCGVYILLWYAVFDLLCSGGSKNFSQSVP